MKSKANDVIDILEEGKEVNENQEDHTSLCNSRNQLDGRWSKEEHNQFIEACLLFGDNWKQMSSYIRTRSISQIRSHCQKYIKKLAKNQKEVKKRVNNIIDILDDFPIKQQDIDRLSKFNPVTLLATEQKEDIIVLIFTFRKNRNRKQFKNSFYSKIDQNKNFFQKSLKKQNQNQNNKSLLNHQFKWKTKLLRLSNSIISDTVNEKEENEAQILLTKQILQKNGNIFDYLLQQKTEETSVKIDSFK